MMWYCNNCGEDFDVPSVAYTDDDEYEDCTCYYVCPLCGSDNINEL